MVEPLTTRRVLEQNLNPMPENETESSVLLITPQDGRAKIGAGYKSVNQFKVHTHTEDKRQIMDTWDLKTALTSDTRLSNLKKEQEAYVQWTVKIEGMCLRQGLGKPAANASWLRSAILEPGLGREGFLRKSLNTVNTKSESINMEEKPTQRTILGFPIGGK